MPSPGTPRLLSNAILRRRGTDPTQGQEQVAGGRGVGWGCGVGGGGWGGGGSGDRGRDLRNNTGLDWDPRSDTNQKC